MRAPACLAAAFCLLALPVLADQPAARQPTLTTGLAAQAAPHHPARPPAGAMHVSTGAARSVAEHGVLYAARGGSGAFGLVIGEADRMTAHREAERACAAQAPGCRPVAEFNAACGAAAQSIRRSPATLFVSAGPPAYVIGATHAGSGPTQSLAERNALAECRAREPQAGCRIAASGCAGRS